MQPGYVVIWTYVVKPESIAEFEAAYHSDGEWAAFFRRSPDHLKTEFLRDEHVPHRYTTIDYWSSKEAYLAFRAQWREEYDRFDRKCDEWTSEETHLGTFIPFG